MTTECNALLKSLTIEEMLAVIKPQLQIKCREYQKEYRQRPEVKARINAYQRQYNQKPEVKAKRNAYQRRYSQRPDVKAKIRATMIIPR